MKYDNGTEPLPFCYFQHMFRSLQSLLLLQLTPHFELKLPDFMIKLEIQAFDLNGKLLFT